ncbi:MAG: hypothetical protein KDA91_07905 [Planctomycetaceae bacterium]|nr:hypothetical protein [Planctomycetaceae bacterium]
MRDPTVRIAAVSNTETRGYVVFVNAAEKAPVTFSIASGNLFMRASLLGE